MLRIVTLLETGFPSTVFTAMHAKWAKYPNKVQIPRGNRLNVTEVLPDPHTDRFIHGN